MPFLLWVLLAVVLVCTIVLSSLIATQTGRVPPNDCPPLMPVRSTLQPICPECATEATIVPIELSVLPSQHRNAAVIARLSKPMDTIASHVGISVNEIPNHARALGLSLVSWDEQQVVVDASAGISTAWNIGIGATLEYMTVQPSSGGFLVFCTNGDRDIQVIQRDLDDAVSFPTIHTIHTTTSSPAMVSSLNPQDLLLIDGNQLQQLAYDNETISATTVSTWASDISQPVGQMRTFGRSVAIRDNTSTIRIWEEGKLQATINTSTTGDIQWIDNDKFMYADNARLFVIERQDSVWTQVAGPIGQLIANDDPFHLVLLDSRCIVGISETTVSNVRLQVFDTSGWTLQNTYVVQAADNGFATTVTGMRLTIDKQLVIGIGQTNGITSALLANILVWENAMELSTTPDMRAMPWNVSNSTRTEVIISPQAQGLVFLIRGGSTVDLHAPYTRVYGQVGLAL